MPPTTRRGDVLALVQAGGQGSRMDVLTRERAKPVLPYAGTHRLIDFTLSSLAHSGLVDVWVSVEYQVASLDDYLSGGRPWSLDRNRGGFRRMVPQTGSGPATEDAFAHGNADQPDGRVTPENSAPTAGLRITSPFAVSDTWVPAPVVPAPNSALVVSIRLTIAPEARKPDSVTPTNCSRHGSASSTQSSTTERNSSPIARL